MKRYYYRRINGELIFIDCEQMFWSGTACVFVKGGLASAVVSLLPGEIVAQEEIGKPNEPDSQQANKPN